MSFNAYFTSYKQGHERHTMKSFLKKSLSPGDTNFRESIGLLILRIIFGGMMLLNHGLPKLDKDLSDLPNPLNLNPSLSGGLILFAELFCSGLIILGLAGRWAAAVLSIAMATAFFIFHRADFKEGEMALIYLAAFTCILFTGPGAFSIDRIFNKK